MAFAEEVRAVSQLFVRRIHQLQPRFMRQRGGLQSMARGFAAHLVRGHAAQFVIDQREQFFRGQGVALLDGRGVNKKYSVPVLSRFYFPGSWHGEAIETKARRCCVRIGNLDGDFAKDHRQPVGPADQTIRSR